MAESKSEKEKEDLRSFTSQKMDILNALSMAPNITGGEFRVAFRLMQHCNSETGAIFPSQLAIADQVGSMPKQVSVYINRLIEKGWLHKSRTNRQSTNSYHFDPKNINAVLDIQSSRKDWREDQRQKRLSDRRNTDPQKSLTGAIPTLPTGAIPTLSTSAIAPPNTLREHQNGTPELEVSLESKSIGNTREAEQKTKGIESDANQKAIAINAKPLAQGSKPGNSVDQIIRKPVFSLNKKIEEIE